MSVGSWFIGVLILIILGGVFSIVEQKFVSPWIERNEGRGGCLKMVVTAVTFQVVVVLLWIWFVPPGLKVDAAGNVNGFYSVLEKLQGERFWQGQMREADREIKDYEKQLREYSELFRKMHDSEDEAMSRADAEMAKAGLKRSSSDRMRDAAEEMKMKESESVVTNDIYGSLEKTVRIRLVIREKLKEY